MRIFLCILIAGMTLNLDAAEKELFRYWTVTTASSLEIHGTTNVNSFECGYAYYHGSDMIREVWNPSSEEWEISGSVFVEVEEFDCQNKMMNNDFRKTLHSSTYPDIKIEFLNLREFRSEGNNRKARGWIEISLAGNSSKYFVTCDLVFVSNYYSILSGKQVFRFSDFGLVPPQKGFGLVKVNDEITVQFDLILEQIALTDN
jgi:hypothetical protein